MKMPAVLRRAGGDLAWWWELLKQWRHDPASAWWQVSYFAYARACHHIRFAVWKADRPTFGPVADEVVRAATEQRGDVIESIQRERDGTLWFLPNPTSEPEPASDDSTDSALARLDEVTALLDALHAATRPGSHFDPRTN